MYNIAEELLAEIDELLSDQINVLLHDPSFQALESAWRGLRFLVDRIPAQHNIVLQILNVSKDDLRTDFEDAPEIIRSGLYFHVYVSQYGQFGGEPVGALIGNYSFDSRPEDIRLLASIAAVSAMAHAPFIAAVDKGFFGIDSWEELPNLSDLHALFEMSQYAAWRSFRTCPDARYVGLTLPRFLLRAPYGPEAQAVSSFRFTADVEDPASFSSTTSPSLRIITFLASKRSASSADRSPTRRISAGCSSKYSRRRSMLEKAIAAKGSFSF